MNYHSLEELQARAFVHADGFEPWQRHAAEKAVTRLVQDAASGTALSFATATPADLLVRHAELIVAAGIAKNDEPGMLRRLLTLPGLPAGVAARIVSGSATLADALVALDCRSDLARARGRLRGAVERFAIHVAGPAPAGLTTIPARLSSVNSQLKRLSHTSFGIAAQSWDSFCSRIRRVVKLVDRTEGRSLRKSQLVGAWAHLVQAVEDQAGGSKPKSKRTSAERTVAGYLAKLWPFVAFCSRKEIEPEAVIDGTIEQFLADCIVGALSDPFAIARNVVYAWENLQRLVPGFPEQRLSRLYQDGYARTGRLPFEHLPASLQQDWHNFVERNQREPIQDLTALVVDPGQARPKLGKARRAMGTLAANRIPKLKSAVTLAANACIALGGRPDRVTDVLSRTVVERSLEDALARKRAKDPEAPGKSSTLKGLAANLLKIGQLLGISPDQERALIDLRDDVDPHLIEIRTDKNGKESRVYEEDRMGPRHRERLEQFNDPLMLHAWFMMTPTLYGRMKRIVTERRAPDDEDVNDAIACVLHAISQCCPVRNANLAGITILGADPWLTLPRFKGDHGRLRIPAEFVKNRKQIDADLTPDATEIVRMFVEHFRPVLAREVEAAPDNPYLFPAADQKHRCGTHLNRIFTDRNWRIGGFVLNLQCQRHICGKLILDEDPTRMALVQILLDHKSIQVTQRFYTRVNKVLAQREFLALVEARRQKVLSIVAKKPRNPRRGGNGNGRTKK